MNASKKIFWFVIFILLVIFTIYTMVSQSEDFSLQGFIEYTKEANKIWMVFAVLCMLLFIYIEGMSIRYIAKFLGYRRSKKRGFLYSTANIYFSAITPSATGGQPASAFFMVRDGIPISVTAMALVLNLAMYTVTIVVVGFACLLIRPGIIGAFDQFSRLLIFSGFMFQSIGVFIFVMLVCKEKPIFKVADGLICIGQRLRIIRNADMKRKRLEYSAKEYKQCAIMIKDHGDIVWHVFLLNILQRVSQIAVTVCVYLATGGEWKHLLEVFATQGCVMLGSNAVPLPGAVGIADYLFLDGFQDLFGENTMSIELLSRGISFYGCVILSGIVVFIVYLIDIKIKRGSHGKQQSR